MTDTLAPPRPAPERVLIQRRPRGLLERFPYWHITPTTWAFLALAVAVEWLTISGVLGSLFSIGRIPVGASIVPVALVLGAVAIGGCTSRRPIWLPGVVVGVAIAGISAVSAAVYVLEVGTIAEAWVLLVLAAVEEVVYRLAVPALVALGLMAVGRSRGPSVMAGVVAGALFFAGLPGHLDQLRQPFELVIFIAFAIVMSHAVWQGRTIVPAIVAHATTNFLTMAMLYGSLPSVVRDLGVAISLGLLLVYGLRAPAVDPEDDEEELIIDLRDSVRIAS